MQSLLLLNEEFYTNCICLISFSFLLWYQEPSKLPIAIFLWLPPAHLVRTILLHHHHHLPCLTSQWPNTNNSWIFSANPLDLVVQAQRLLLHEPTSLILTQIKFTILVLVVIFFLFPPHTHLTLLVHTLHHG